MKVVKTKGKNYYKAFSKEELILRDHLAIDRTAMANEVSFLAYVRTALTILVGGVSLLHFFSEFIFQVLGWVAIIISIVTIGIGFFRFRHMHRVVSEIRSYKKK